MYCELKDIRNESDVEQKLILPMLRSGEPGGFNYSPADFSTKETLVSKIIDKGTSKRRYVPDYLIHIGGIPCVVIEAKTRGENLDNAYREARLYAMELNAMYSPEIDPCDKILVSNGDQIKAGFWNTETFYIELDFDDIHIGGDKFAQLIKFLSKRETEKTVQIFQKKIKGDRVYLKPTRVLGGFNVQNEKIRPNDLGVALSFAYTNIFDPQEDEDRKKIVEHAYITTRKLGAHLEPIRKVILAAQPASILDATEIQDTARPKELISAFSGSDLRKKVMLLIGNVGSGKSTFVDYLRYVALPEGLKENTIWMVLNLNNAPMNQEIYTWVRQRVVETLNTQFDAMGFDGLETQLKLYGLELKVFEKSIGALLNRESTEYKKLLADKLIALQSNLDITARAYTRYLGGQTGKLPILVLDNCDKGNAADQLLMFQVAQWAKEEFHCLVFLPLRDTTYELNKDTSPLDTAVKNLTFRIDPPNISQVLQRRVEYGLSVGPREITYTVENGITFRCTKVEQSLYLNSILHSLFENTGFFKTLMEGMAGRDIRRGVEIFLDFCKSGHIPSIEYLRIRATGGAYILPNHIVSRAMFRMDRRFYSDSNPYIRNLFVSYPDSETIPNPFTRLAILTLLESIKGFKGPNNIPGFHKVDYVISTLSLHGHTEERILAEVHELVKARCLTAETLIDGRGEISLSGDDLIKISPAGYIHLSLLSNIDYIASCAEDVWYRDQELAKTVAGRITGRVGRGHFTFLTAFNIGPPQTTQHNEFPCNTRGSPITRAHYEV